MVTATAPRAAATNGKWNLAITLKSDVTKDNITKVFGAWDNSTYNAKLYALRINGKDLYRLYNCCKSG